MEQLSKCVWLFLLRSMLLNAFVAAKAFFPFFLVVTNSSNYTISKTITEILTANVLQERGDEFINNP
jgi:hypothetical protein